MNRREVLHAVNDVCAKRRTFTILDKLTETADGFEARIYTRLSDLRDLEKAFDKVGLAVRMIANLDAEWFLFTLVVKRKR